ncbi:MAG: hypothetical protein H7039_03890 [Bryobacteraceae bacterium]|nr:hypothetical protein [Bryobacteraceae bacterium]
MFLRCFLGLMVISSAANADFSYGQSTKVTGGAAAGMMKMAGAFSKTAREPIESTVLLKGDRLATVSRDMIHIIDLQTETMINVDMAKRTYSSMTFAEMAEAMKRMSEKMSAKKPEGEMKFKVDVKQTGNTRVISGMNTNETIMTLTMEGTDRNSGNKGSMDMQTDMWIAPNMPGYGEVRDFYRRMAGKVSWSPMSSALGPMMAQNAKGMDELVKEMSKLDGVPVLQITKIGMSGDGTQPASEGNAPTASSPTASEVATAAGSSGALGRAGRIGALAGGLGGFGRKKKSEPEQTVASTPPSAAGSGALVEMTTELTGFSSAPVDASRLAIPSGFREVESEMKKALR